MKLVLESQNPTKDIEAIAKSRVNRAGGNKPLYFLLGTMLSGIALVYMVNPPPIIIWIVGGACIAYYIWGMRSIDKKVNIAKHQLLREWEKENK